MVGCDVATDNCSYGRLLSSSLPKEKQTKIQLCKLKTVQNKFKDDVEVLV